MLREKDITIWEKALPYLDVRSNDVHTLYSYALIQELLNSFKEAKPDIVLPAILLHDTGWKKIPQDKILQAFGPNRKYPELQRQHELESVIIAQEVLSGLGYANVRIKEITDIIDGHDTTTEARSINDLVVKEGDKLWRYTAHGIQTIQGWFSISKSEVLDILDDFVLPKFLSKEGKMIASHFLKAARMEVALDNKEIKL